MKTETEDEKEMQKEEYDEEKRTYIYFTYLY